jgi:hypothetical protein
MRYFVITGALVLVVSGCAKISMPNAGSGVGGAGATAGAGGSGFYGAGGGYAGQTTRADGGVVISPIAGTINSDVGDTVTVSGQPAQAKFTLHLNDGSQPKVTWAVDDTKIGSIGDDGVYHANGYVGGVVTVTAMVGAGRAVTTITVNVDITDDPKTLDPMDLTTLKAGGSDPQFTWLYPYDKTVFPRGLAPPILQFSGNNGTRATYMTITTAHFSYKQFANLNDPLQVTIPVPIWKGLTLTAGPKDTVTVSVNKLAGNVGSGPLTQSWSIAPASISGVFYYSTYKGSMLTNGGGGIMRIPAGQNAQLAVAGSQNGRQCTACHTVSANGNVLAAGSDNMPTPGSITATNPGGDWNPVTSQTYTLAPTVLPALRTTSMDGQMFSFVGLTPDGSMGLVSGLPPKRNWPFLPHGVQSTPGTPSRLVDTMTGMTIAAPSLSGLVQYATTPAFSPDGLHVAFVNGDRLGPTCVDKTCTGACLQACQRVLSVMDFDGKASPPAFSKLTDLVTGMGAGTAVAWPAFLPDGKGVLFHLGDSLDSDQFVSDAAPLTPQLGELRLVEPDKTVNTLNALNGRDATGMSYLPNGETIEGRMNYEPSVLPVAVGGYYWVLFTSRRTYGNTISLTSGDPQGKDPFGTEANPSPRKKVWIAAIDIDHAGKADPSHPAFYLPGQELRTANMRAFAALAPCQTNGVSCETGADCCGGYCRETSRSADGVPTLQCVPPPANTCSFVSEPCKTPADCCDPTNLCINNRCATPTIIP